MKKNILANFIGRFWGIISNFLFIPLYIKFLGLESYSIISFTLVITAFLAIMDAGLTSTLSREFASSTNNQKDKYSVFKTLESCYLIISALAILITILGASSFAKNWLNLDNLSPEKVAIFLRIFGIEVGFKFLAQFYSGGFIGLEKQVKGNAYMIVWGIFRNGLVLVPIYFYPSLETFFSWQTITTIIYVLIIRLDLISTLSNQKKNIFFEKPIIDKEILSRVWKFAGGMFLIAVVAAINTQMDRLTLSKLLPIEVLGLYTLAFSLSRGLNLVAQPFSKALLPRFTFYYTSNSFKKGISLFKKGYIIVGIIVFTCSACLMLYAKDLIWVWTNNIELAEEACRYVPWIASGTGFLAMQGLPFNIAIANSFTKYNNYLGIFSLVITIPSYWIFTSRYGGTGAAATFSISQIIITFIYLFLVNYKFLHLPLLKLFSRNILIPLALSLIVIFILKQVIIVPENRLAVLLKIGLSAIGSLIVNTMILIPMKDIISEYQLLKNKLLKNDR
ncbi:lipopolysaccharide biosynthesis protein [Sunxiuqinia sp. sy24]|uniref:lipopolysaccharide biosynthesis protein n=1 Tax=Sunxiuqinia sp. sy24 TaxID=3461495 RepID=UPI004046468F